MSDVISPSIHESVPTQGPRHTFRGGIIVPEYCCFLLVGLDTACRLRDPIRSHGCSSKLIYFDGISRYLYNSLPPRGMG